MVSSPAIIRSSVDFPEPDGPRKTTSSPEWISRLRSRMTSTEPKLLEMPEREIVAMHILRCPSSFRVRTRCQGLRSASRLLGGSPFPLEPLGSLALGRKRSKVGRAYCSARRCTWLCALSACGDSMNYFAFFPSLTNPAANANSKVTGFLPIRQAQPESVSRRLTGRASQSSPIRRSRRRRRTSWSGWSAMTSNRSGLILAAVPPTRRSWRQRNSVAPPIDEALYGACLL